jgi:hypothetical protein
MRVTESGASSIVNRRIEEAIAAFEAIRLDLLRIRSGVGSHDDLKSDLEVARQMVVPGPARLIPCEGKPA